MVFVGMGKFVIHLKHMFQRKVSTPRFTPQMIFQLRNKLFLSITLMSCHPLLSIIRLILHVLMKKKLTFEDYDCGYVLSKKFHY